MDKHRKSEEKDAVTAFQKQTVAELKAQHPRIPIMWVELRRPVQGLKLRPGFACLDCPLETQYCADSKASIETHFYQIHYKEHKEKPRSEPCHFQFLVYQGKKKALLRNG